MDAYRKVGRGGAGNFYSQKDIDEATKPSNSASDLEAQRPGPPMGDETPSDPADEPAPGPPSTSTPAASSSSTGAGAGAGSSAPAYTRSGRGGAGNFVDPQTAAAAAASVFSNLSGVHPKPATVQSTGNQSFTAQAPSRYTGRGGAGNWGTGDEAQRVVNEEQERKRKEALDAKVFDDVMAGLQEPGRAHTRVHPHGVGSSRARGGGVYEDV
jgi:hypothetical protein